jgi:hypothetical protein
MPRKDERRGSSKNDSRRVLADGRVPVVSLDVSAVDKILEHVGIEQKTSFPNFQRSILPLISFSSHGQPSTARKSPARTLSAGSSPFKCLNNFRTRSPHRPQWPALLHECLLCASTQNGRHSGCKRTHLKRRPGSSGSRSRASSGRFGEPAGSSRVRLRLPNCVEGASQQPDGSGGVKVRLARA